MRKHFRSILPECGILNLGCKNSCAHFPRWIAAGVIAAGMFTAMPSTLWGQSKTDSRRFTASVSAGIARPSDRAFRELYGSIQYPVSVQADYGLSRNVLVFGEYGHVSRSGKAQVVEAAFAPGGDVLRFRAHTANVGLLYVFPVRKLAFLLGGGVGFRFYRETWAAAGVTTSGNKAGLAIQGGVEYELARSLALVGRVEYSRMEIEAASTSENDVSLARLEASIGISFRLNRLLHK
jgi:opacity protein-like surface antigen